jgi:superfamily II DNA or RNA helicase/HKD family nuclease
VSELPAGLYDQLIDALLGERITSLEANRVRASIEAVDPAELPDRVGEAIGDWAREALAATSSGDRANAAVQVSAAVLNTIAALRPDAVGESRRLIEPVSRLVAIERLAPTDEPIRIGQPLTPLRDTVLMTNARDQPAVGHEIKAEIESADQIDVVLAFIRWTGIRDLIARLRRHVETGKSIRVITTTYTGSTELRALQELAELGAQIKVSYDTGTTRLHAKAWLFHRATGFSTVYIGSSNLTFTAQVTGLEWNVRASERRNPDLIAAFERTFDTYWADPHFEDFDPERFTVAASMAASATDERILTPFDIEPYPFQRQMLEQLQVARQRGHMHNLVVAATGTGKTIVAALDYRQLRTDLDRTRLLFIAHRDTILRQSRTTFRHVLRDGSFGELWVGGTQPTQWEHVFASIQSLSVHDVRSIDPEQFDIVVVDEFHHAAAASYEVLLDHLRPKHLVGLTATPERADGLDVLRWFGGRIAVELRLWDALEQGLLAPFHYFGVHDSTDLAGVTWRRGTGYDVDELTNLYTASDLWVSKVIAAVREKVGDPHQMRALGFCVGIDHARFMADRFNRAGIASRAVTASTPGAERQQVLHDLRDGKLQTVFTVDLFNEGVDVPAIDVVLMLRPTESATIFLQQLGRGLRRTEGKDVLTVLDFVGHQSANFRFDLRYRRMLGRTRRELEQDIEQDFPYLPAGCRIELDPVARKIVLDNVRNALPTTWKARVSELRDLGDVTLAEFLQESGLELEDLYANGHTWTELRRSAGQPMSPAVDGEERVGRGVGRLLHIDDQDRLDVYRRLLSNSQPPAAAELDWDTRRQLEGLLLTVLSPRKGMYDSLDSAARELWRHAPIRNEVLELLPLLEDQVIHLHRRLDLPDPVPLQIHATYTREEILGALGASTVTAPLPLQTGVYWHEPTQTDLFFVTLQKTERDYSPTTRYLDYAISDRLFHWESQSLTSVASATGQRYLNHEERGTHVALFIRRTKRDASGRTMPYFSAGTASYVEHRSERPIQITWRLHDPLPGDTFAAYRAAVA